MDNKDLHKAVIKMITLTAGGQDAPKQTSLIHCIFEQNQGDSTDEIRCVYFNLEKCIEKKCLKLAENGNIWLDIVDESVIKQKAKTDKESIKKICEKLNKKFLVDTEWRFRIFIEIRKTGLTLIYDKEEILGIWCNFYDDKLQEFANEPRRDRGFKERENYDLYKNTLKEIRDDFFLKYKYLPKLELKSDVLAKKRKKRFQDALPHISDYIQYLKSKYQNIDTSFLEGLLPPIAVKEIFRDLELSIIESPFFSLSKLTKGYQEWAESTHGFLKELKLIRKPVLRNTCIKRILTDGMNEVNYDARHFVILGGPGSGKTTLLKALCYLIASNEICDKKTINCVPIFVDLSEYVESRSTSLLKFATENPVKGIINPEKKGAIKNDLGGVIDWFRKKEENNNDVDLFLIFDSLDETGEFRKHIIHEIDDLRSNYPEAFLIVASRIVDYERASLDSFKHYLINDLSPKDTRGFIEDWFHCLPQVKTKGEHSDSKLEWANGRIEFLNSQIENEPNLMRLASTPLFLTFLCFLASEPDTKALPQTRSKLYKEFFGQHIIKWEEKHEGSLPNMGDDFLSGFNEICWIIHRSLYGDIKDRRPTRGFIKKFLTNVSSTDREKSLRDFSSSDWEMLLRFWIRSGVLFLAKDQNRDDLVLSQLQNFLEYGFAGRLATLWDDLGKKEDVYKALESNFNNASLYEVLLLFIDQINTPADFLERIWKSKIVSNKDDMFHRNLILLADLTHEVKEKLRETNLVAYVVDQLKKIINANRELTVPIWGDVLKNIAFLGGFDALKELFEEETPKEVRIEIAWAFSHVEDPNAISSIQELYENETDLDVKATLSMLITKAKDDQGLHTSEASLNDDGPSDEKGVMTQNLGGQALSDAIMKLFTEASVPGARQGLARIIGKKADEAIIPWLEKVYKEENDPDVKMALAATIGELGKQETAIHFLQKLFKKLGSTIYKLHVAVVMARLGDKKLAIEHLEQLLGETDPYIRRRVITSICHIGDETHLPLFKRLFGAEKDININMLIARMIGLSGEKSYAIELLNKLLEEENSPHVELHLASLIGDMGDKETAIQVLDRLLNKEKDSGIRRLCILAIRRLDDEKTKPVVKEKLEGHYTEEKDVNNKMLIGRILGDLGEKEKATDFLTNLSKIVDDPHMKLHLASAIGDIGDKDSAFEIFKSLLGKEEDPHIKLHIVSSIGHLANAVDIQDLKDLYGEQNDASVKRSLAIAIYRLAQKERLLIFEKEDGEIVPEKIPERYSLGI
jgi:HEAT repeat protein